MQTQAGKDLAQKIEEVSRISNADMRLAIERIEYQAHEAAIRAAEQAVILLDLYEDDHEVAVFRQAAAMRIRRLR